MSEVIVGIDLGTTNSLVAVCENGMPRVLKSPDGTCLVPSIIYWPDEEDVPVVGLAAKRQRIVDAAHTAYSVKRFIGRGKQDLDPSLLSAVDTSASTDKNILIKLGQRSVSAIELSAKILKKLKLIAEQALGHPVSKAVVTVPAYFNDSQRTATKIAGQLAGLEVIRIINEPTAAALAYGLNRKKNGNIIVYDLGGGTFDVSILRLHDGIFEVLATNGDTALGGDDFDQALVSLIVNKTSLLSEMALKLTGHEADHSALELKALLIEAAEKTKIELSVAPTAQVKFNYANKQYICTITREEFDDAIEGLVAKTIAIAKSALIDSGLDKNTVDDVVMVGGSTRVLKIRQRVKEFFGRELDISVNPDEVVALGAAIQGDILSGRNQSTVLLDVVPLSLGIETYGGTIGKLIHRNTKIPSMATETFTTHVDGQRNVLIHVLQGERELVTDCRSLACFELKGLPPLPAGAPKIQVTFLVDANGILKVRAKELGTQLETAIEVKPSYGLTDEQVEKMLGDSFDFAEQDMSARQLIETRVQAEGVLRSAEKIMNEAENLGEVPERKAVKNKMSDVKNLMAGTDYIAVKNALEELEVLAKPVAEKVMNLAISKSLSHKHVEDVLKKGDR